LLEKEKNCLIRHFGIQETLGNNLWDFQVLDKPKFNRLGW